MSDLSDLKIGFFGTPEFSVNFLDFLLEKKAEISFVVSQPAAYSGRGKKLKVSPTHEWAQKNKKKILTPDDITKKEFRETIKSKKVDFIIVVAYGKLIDDYIINAPKFLTINVHASLLPKWRGAAPIQRSILNGDKETGVCIMKVEKKLDAGPVIKQTKIKIENTDDAGSIYKKIILKGKNLLIEAIKDIKCGDFNYIFQDEENATYAQKIEKRESKIDWEESAESIILKVRAFNPYPGAWTFLQKKRLKILKAKVYDGFSQKLSASPNGTFDDQLIVKCKKSFLQVIELKLQGKKKMAAKEFLNGYKNKEFLFE